MSRDIEFKEEKDGLYKAIVRDNHLTKDIPLLFEKHQLLQIKKNLQELTLSEDISFEYFSAIIAGCIITEMKRRPS